jgi:hypothetical protein
MLFNLAKTLPGERHGALREQLELLDAMLEKNYYLPADLALARIADSQGLGGSTESGEPVWATEAVLSTHSNPTPALTYV